MFFQLNRKKWDKQKQSLSTHPRHKVQPDSRSRLCSCVMQTPVIGNVVDEELEMNSNPFIENKKYTEFEH